MSEWQPIETAPKGVYILVCDEAGNVGVAFNGIYQVRGQDAYVEGNFNNEYNLAWAYATHWMPLPEPPQ